MKYKACEECFRVLYNLNKKSAMFWLQLVEDHDDTHKYLFFCLEENQINELEFRGFVLSHEIPDRILFVLLGKQSDHFCIDPDNHNPPACA